ncbi:4-oxalocrotonate tautomerase family protein [Streptomyces sp. Tu 3180]|uniref:tautomerase family protein n=1 Tax=Streptomyces sp. Tu 3180 TaxID=2682611 RepID=UPI00135727D5|nr:4-oxalocrotonate tautomerase family protein [Streptomyces sp. Tu 3180]KAF3468926.1 4-oxalocrotonate tautomerase family protein [Streptomyces sp. Tu 3180]
MPLIEVKLYEGRLEDGNDAKLIAALTDAVGRVLGDAAREQTWVTLQEVPRARWGIAGRPGS